MLPQKGKKKHQLEKSHFLRAKHFWGYGAVQNILRIIVLTYKHLRAGLSFQCLFITTFSPFCLVACTLQNMCNVVDWDFFFGGVVVLVVRVVFVWLCWGCFFTVALCLCF